MRIFSMRHHLYFMTHNLSSIYTKVHNTINPTPPNRIEVTTNVRIKVIWIGAAGIFDSIFLPLPLPLPFPDLQYLPGDRKWLIHHFPKPPPSYNICRTYYWILEKHWEEMSQNGKRECLPCYPKWHVSPTHTASCRGFTPSSRYILPSTPLHSQSFCSHLYCHYFR